MAALLRKIIPLEKSFPLDSDINIEYSFAIEYHGSPITFDIPKLVPIDVDRLPIAAEVSSSFDLNDLSLPVIQPIVKTNPLNQKPTKGKKFGSGRKSIVHPGLSLSSSDDPGVIGCSEIQEVSDVNNATPCHVKRPSVVTFLEPESIDVEDSDSFEIGSSSVHDEQPVERKGKKGSCYRCLKGNRFTEKEACIVCNAKYCYKCVMRTMGSMPEGRKCVACIGKKINEARRGSLGKRSRLLKQLLDELEVQRVMRSERACEANRLPPQLVVVNGEPLCQDDLEILQSCQNPPEKLKPGFYWYDKLSGFWGKEGHGPCQIITSQLNIGAHIERNASNGNTNIVVNNREITKKELWMLQLAGVHCEGSPSFWLSADGSYQEEGQNNIKGPIWNKVY